MNILKIAKSYIKNKNQNGMSKFHSWLAITGIALGVTAFIVVSSVMGGIFQKIYHDINIKNNYDLSISGHNITEVPNIIDFIGKEKIKTYLNVKKLDRRYYLSLNNKEIIVHITEDPFFSKEGIYINSKLKTDKKAVFLKMNERSNSIGGKPKVLDQDLFPINIMTTEDSLKYPVGLDNVVMSKETFENSFFDEYKTTNIILFKMNNFMETFEIDKKLVEKYSISNNYNKDTWFSKRKNLLENLTIEYTVIKIVLFFVIIVSAFSVMSTITLIISEKKQDIYVLKTIGYSDYSVVSVFLISGVLIGVLGIILGVFSGLIISLNMREILSFAEATFNIKLFPESLKSFPIVINYYDFIKIGIITLFIIFFSSLIPALKTVSISPAEGLKSE